MQLELDLDTKRKTGCRECTHQSWISYHLSLFRVDFTYDELQEWHEIYTLLKYGRQGGFVEKDV